MDILKTLAAEFNVKEEQVKSTIDLIDEGNTIPFISRYRKEVTGGLDDATLRDLNDRLQYLRKMEERRAEISSLIEAQEKLTKMALAYASHCRIFTDTMTLTVMVVYVANDRGYITCGVTVSKGQVVHNSVQYSHKAIRRALRGV